MDLYTEFLPFAIALVVLAAVAAVVGLGVIVTEVASNRRQRIARHESIPAYYRGLVLSH